eukprot:EG_transcript_34651
MPTTPSVSLPLPPHYPPPDHRTPHSGPPPRPGPTGAPLPSGAAPQPRALDDLPPWHPLRQPAAQQAEDNGHIIPASSSHPAPPHTEVPARWPQPHPSEVGPAGGSPVAAPFINALPAADPSAPTGQPISAATHPPPTVLPQSRLGDPSTLSLSEEHRVQQQQPAPSPSTAPP